MATTSIRSITDTWNDGGTTFNAIQMTVTDSASAADSNLINLKVASDSKFLVGKDGATTVKSSAADALTVGAGGASDPAFQVDASTGSAATGIKITGKAAASGVAVAVISSGTNENLTVDAKGSGTITLNPTGTGNVVSARPLTVAGTATVTSNNASALAVGPNGATNPALKVDGSVASAATGVNVVGRAAGAGASVAVISSGTNEDLTIDAKGSGTVTINATGTGAIALARNTAVTGTLGVSGNVAVNTDKFNVTAASGNTAIAGTLSTGGSITIGSTELTEANLQALLLLLA